MLDPLLKNKEAILKLIRRNDETKAEDSAAVLGKEEFLQIAGQNHGAEFFGNLRIKRQIPVYIQLHFCPVRHDLNAPCAFFVYFNYTTFL